MFYILTIASRLTATASITNLGIINYAHKISRHWGLEAFDSNGKYIGIVSEHLKLISNLTGINFKMSPSKTWTESTEKAKNGLVDILSETDDSDLKSLRSEVVISYKVSTELVKSVNTKIHLSDSLKKPVELLPQNS